MKICTGKNIGNVVQTDIRCCLLNVYRDQKNGCGDCQEVNNSFQ